MGPPQLLDEVLPFLDHVDGHLQGRLLLLAEPLDEVLHGLHRLGVHVVQQLLLQLLQPCPQLEGDREAGHRESARGLQGSGAAAWGSGREEKYPRQPAAKRHRKRSMCGCEVRK